MNSNLFFKTVKKTSTMLCAVTLFLSTLAFGQVPDAINYQAAVRSTSGNVMANTNTMTVILTPLDASSKGVAVIEKTMNGFTVKELSNGTGSYSFDWEVKCVRKGYEEYKVIRDGEDCKASGNSELLKDISQKKAE
ncbi:hypothetical protein Oweho_0592 [Owenweeksia hongkongensis DSM 17368]|uniref:Carboxypeptidase regulatory-like domain-containing protein n=1 Tax=Owenweeksia hongkongensis (strain DSM 17368 / CIP 108786 / JCM 12287 / NRRL B-23963 / UST20020801) TaxID=926562 RepID=G8R0E7_OWEHD|nr:hypothetical protein [Owenweeksia hongkongensis]AEV31607.1 hypothetical protein Oweho_0592 [Owenweeksia hongkongensis DSM 17368]